MQERREAEEVWIGKDKANQNPFKLSGTFIQWSELVNNISCSLQNIFLKGDNGKNMKINYFIPKVRLQPQTLI